MLHTRLGCVFSLLFFSLFTLFCLHLIRNAFENNGNEFICTFQIHTQLQIKTCLFHKCLNNEFIIDVRTLSDCVLVRRCVFFVFAFAFDVCAFNKLHHLCLCVCVLKYHLWYCRRALWVSECVANAARHTHNFFFFLQIVVGISS